MSKHRVPVTYRFSGYYGIEAASQEQVEGFAHENCGLVMGRGTHSSMPDEDVDWEFPGHPDEVAGECSGDGGSNEPTY